MLRKWLRAEASGGTLSARIPFYRSGEAKTAANTVTEPKTHKWIAPVTKTVRAGANSDEHLVRPEEEWEKNAPFLPLRRHST